MNVLKGLPGTAGVKIGHGVDREDCTIMSSDNERMSAWGPITKH